MYHSGAYLKKGDQSATNWLRISKKVSTSESKSLNPSRRPVFFSYDCLLDGQIDARRA